MYIVSIVSDCTYYGEEDGSIELTIQGGVSPYHILWDDDINLVDLSRYFLDASIYTVTITDSASNSWTESYEIKEPKILYIGPEFTNISYHGEMDGSIIPNVSGGTLPYVYSWDTGSQSDRLSNLGEGEYSFTVTERYGHSKTRVYHITDPGPLRITYEINNCRYFNIPSGSITIHVFGGSSSPNYSFLWNDLITDCNRTELRAGFYSVQISDIRGSTINESWIISELSQFTISSVEVTNASSFDASDGSIILQAEGGIEPYTYIWKNSDFEIVSRTFEVTNAKADTYTAVVKDAYKTAIIESVTVTEPFASVLASDIDVLSAIISWPLSLNAILYTIYVSPSSTTTPYRTLQKNTSMTRIENMSPDTEYTVRVYMRTWTISQKLVGSITFRTQPLLQLSKTMFSLDDEIYSFENLNKNTIEIILPVLDDTFQTGDLIKADSLYRDTVDTVETIFLNISDHMTVQATDYVLIPFQSTGERVYLDPDTSVEYIQETNQIKMNGNVYSVGDTFTMNGLEVEVQYLHVEP